MMESIQKSVNSTKSANNDFSKFIMSAFARSFLYTTLRSSAKNSARLSFSSRNPASKFSATFPHFYLHISSLPLVHFCFRIYHLIML